MMLALKHHSSISLFRWCVHSRPFSDALWNDKTIVCSANFDFFPNTIVIYITRIPIYRKQLVFEGSALYSIRVSPDSPFPDVIGMKTKGVDIVQMSRPSKDEVEELPAPRSIPLFSRNHLVISSTIDDTWQFLQYYICHFDHGKRREPAS